MPAYVDTKARPFEVALQVAPPVGAAPANLPAVRAVRSLAITRSPLETYRALATEFATASAQVGTSGGATFKVLTSWGYTWRITTGVTLAGAAAALGIHALVCALNSSVELTWVPTAIASGVAFVAALIGAGIAHEDGHCKRWAGKHLERLREKRGGRPLDASKVEFARRAFDRGTPVERAVVANFAGRWLKELESRQVIGKNVRDVLRDIVAEGASLPPDLHASTARMFALVETVYPRDGVAVTEIDLSRAHAILRAAAELHDQEQALLVPRLHELLFDGERPRIKMPFDACQLLLEGLHVRAPQKARL